MRRRTCRLCWSRGRCVGPAVVARACDQIGWSAIRTTPDSRRAAICAGGASVPSSPAAPTSRGGGRFDRVAYRERNRVERTINRLTQHRAIATRYEKLAVSYHALLIIACILLWL